MGHASDRFRSSALPPNQYNEDSLPPAAILVFFIFMAQPRACRPKCLKQVFSHGRTTENLKNALSTPPNQLLQ